MQEYLLLYKSSYNDYYPIRNNMTNPNLWYLNDYFLGDYRYYDENLFTKDQSHYQETIIVNDLKNKEFYISPQEHDIENHIPDDDRPGLTNETNSCKISYENFIEFNKHWLAMKSTLPAFAIIYRDDNGWIDCTGFDSQEEMELFVKNYEPKQHQ